jgi:tetratricopeptide (TPR) repeat protein
MSFTKHYGLRLIARSLLFVAPVFLLSPTFAFCQSRTADETDLRGDHPEIALTIKDTSGQIIVAPATVKIYHSGLLSGQSAASKGRAFFILNALGDYTINVDASGYRSAQREMDASVSIKYEVDIILQREPSSNEAVGVPGKPLLAPKAKDALDKGLQAIGANKLSDAEKYVAEAMKLAPGHPDVLFVQGVLFLSQRSWAQAQNVLEKASQMDPNSARIFSALGMALTDQGKYEEAIIPLEKSLQLDAGGWETHWALGKAYYYRRQYDQALKTSQLALTESSGKAPQIELLVAQSLTAVGRYDDAAQTLREFLKRYGDRPEAPTARRWLDGLANSGKIHPN